MFKTRFCEILHLFSRSQKFLGWKFSIFWKCSKNLISRSISKIPNVSEQARIIEFKNIGRWWMLSVQKSPIMLPDTVLYRYLSSTCCWKIINNDSDQGAKSRTIQTPTYSHHSALLGVFAAFIWSNSASTAVEDNIACEKLTLKRNMCNCDSEEEFDPQEV